MKIIKSILIVLILIQFPQEVFADNKKKADYTFLVYMIGSDMETNFQMASEDLEEMMDIGSSPSVNIVLQTGGAKKWANPVIRSETNQRWLIEQNYMRLLDNIGMGNMDKPQSLTDFITWGVKEYPAKKYVLLFWGHGLGSVDGYGGDENFGNKKMSVAELQMGMEKAYTITEAKFDLIGFDNCKMAGLETAYALKNYGKYMIASVDYTNKNGWDYKEILQAVHDDPFISTIELGKTIAQGYLSQSEENGEEEDLQQSIIDLSKVDDVMKAWDRFSKKMIQELETLQGFSSILYARFVAEDYADESDMVDMVDLSTLIGNSIDARQEAKEISKSVEKAVVFNMKTPEHPRGRGISIYFPAWDKTRFIEKDFIYQSLDFSPHYKEFINKYTYKLDLIAPETDIEKVSEQ